MLSIKCPVCAFTAPDTVPLSEHLYEEHHWGFAPMMDWLREQAEKEVV